MATSLAEKLKIKANNLLVTLHAPLDFERNLRRLPSGVRVRSYESDPSVTGFDQLHWYVLNIAQLEKEKSRVMKLLSPGVTVWVYYPKRSSRTLTDLTRDSGWDCLQAESDKLTRISLVSFDDIWSAFGFRVKTEADRKKEAKPKPEREIFKWVNPATKEVRLPGDLEAALKKNKKQVEFFNTLSFTNKKEYIEWIVTAKREQTREERIKETVERLGKQWKNPRNM